MPTKSAHLIAFLSVLAISLACHRYVYRHWKRVLLRDFPNYGKQLVRVALGLFIVMDLPFVFMFFRRQFSGELTIVSKILLYPFSAWIALMLFWTVVLLISSTIRWTTRATLTIANRVTGADNAKEEPFRPILQE